MVEKDRYEKSNTRPDILQHTYGSQFEPDGRSVEPEQWQYRDDPCQREHECERAVS